MQWNELLQLVDKMTGTSITEAELRQDDVVPFLSATLNELVPIYISNKSLFLYSIAVPLNELPESLTDLPNYSVDPCSSYSYRQSWGESPNPDDFSLSPPGETGKPEWLSKGTPLTSLKYYRYNEHGKYIQLPQDLTDIAQLHRNDETGDFCRIDRNGDHETICHIRVDDLGIVVAIQARVLYAYLLLKKSVLVRLFDVTRIKDNELPLWSNVSREDVSIPEEGIYARFIGDRAVPSNITAMRGAQVIGTERDHVWNQARAELVCDDGAKEYCEFTIIDWKNRRTTVCSCAPEAMSSYYEPSNRKPFETSPAFFKPEVLDRYKNNPDLYELKDRQIYKIDGWSLKTYDVNEAGQVHTYLCYLGDLPYEEQLYWKSFNEAPKGTISKRAYETDFEGKWSELISPAEKLKQLLEETQTELPLLFSRLNSQNIAKLHRVLTDNRKEWADGLLQLDQLIVESIDLSQVRRRAEELNCLNRNLKSVRQLQEMIELLGHQKSEIEVFAELNNLRNKVVGHQTGDEAKRIIKGIRRTHRSFPAHFDNLLERVASSLQFLLDHKDELTSRV